MKKGLLKCGTVCLLTSVFLAACGSKGAEDKMSEGGDDTVLEFYHGYHHNESEWPVAQVMRDLYDDFAKKHADGDVTFKAIPISGSLVDTMNNKVASGEFPDVIDLAGQAVSMAAIEQELVMDLKPFIDENGLKPNVGLNYTQNDVNGKIYTVHEQLFTMGLWYNTELFQKAGAKTPEEWESWDDFTTAMAAVRKVDGTYAFGAGEPAIRLLNTLLGLTEEGRKLLEKPMTSETIESKAFVEALTAVMKEVQANGSENAGGDANAYSADFTANKSAVFFNGVWASGGMVDNPSLQPGIYAGGVAISSSGGGITISNTMTDKEKELALEFMEYMTSDEVQKVIFEKVGANPSNENVDVAGIASSSSDATVKLLGKAISQVKDAKHTVKTISDAWSGDVQNALINAISESAVQGVNIEQKVKETQDILKALIG